MKRYTSSKIGIQKFFNATCVLALIVALGLSAHAGQVTTVNMAWVNQPIFNQFSTLLNAGTVADGDGAIIQLGFYDQATITNNFLGTWHAMTGIGSLNTGGDTGSGHPFNTTSIGDGNGVAGSSGIFDFALDFNSAVTGTFNDLPSSNNIPLAIKFFDGTSLLNSTYYNVVSHDSWLWKIPTTPSPTPPLIYVELNASGLEWQSIAQGQSAATAFHTSIPVPEPTVALLGGLGLAVLATRRRRA